MSQSTTNMVLLLLGVAALGYVVKRAQPGWWNVCLGAVVSGALTLGFVVARRQLALESHAVVGSRRWWDEMLVGGDPLPGSPYAGSERIAGAVVWLLLWAALLHPEARGDDERGPWVLAFLLIALGVGAALALPGIEIAGGVDGGGTGVFQILGLVFVCAVLALGLYWRMRKAR